MDMTAFLRMFTTQLQYQDPTNPLESYELAAQLAQFSTVAELTDIDSNLVKQQSLLTGISNAQMIEDLGKQVTGVGDSLQLKGGSTSSAHYELNASASQATVKIYDDQNQLLRTMEVGQQSAGRYDINWDGLDDSGKAVADGNYHFDVEAVDATGNAVDVTKTISGKVISCRVDNGIGYLVLDNSNGIKLANSAVIEVADPPAS